METIILSSSKNILWVEFFPFWSNLHMQDLYLITLSIEKEIPVFEICLEFWIKITNRVIRKVNGSVLYLNVETKRTQKAISYFSD